MVRWILEIKMIFYFGVTPGVPSAYVCDQQILMADDGTSMALTFAHMLKWLAYRSYFKKIRKNSDGNARENFQMEQPFFPEKKLSKTKTI